MMMIVLIDTHIALWALMDYPKMPKEAEKILMDENNDIYYRQIRKIKETSGEAAIINTSFNIETPIIYNVDDAITAFFKSKLTCLVFNNRIVLKK